MIIGLTGENCSGKGTVAEYLMKKGFYYYSLSDVIREELAKEGREPTRAAMIEKGNLLRKEFGPGGLAVKIKERLDGHKNYVVDSIRNEAEALEMGKIDGFFLWNVSASPELRFERMKNRKREGDPKTLEEFRRMEDIERKSSDASRQSLEDAAKHADLKVKNEGSFIALYDAVDVGLSGVSSTFKMVRPTWDEYFIGIAKMVATRSNCMKRKIGAVIVKDKRIVSTGYNGTPRGTRNCNEGGCPRCNSFAESGTNLGECLCSHAEENSIVQAAYHGISIAGGVMYTTFSPCLLCSKMIINAGIREVVYNEAYPLNEAAGKLLEEAGVVVRKLKV